jgi:hypothetical protein
MRTSQPKPKAGGSSTRFVVLSLVSLAALVAVGYAALRTQQMLADETVSADASRPAAGLSDSGPSRPGARSEQRAARARTDGGAGRDLAARGAEAREGSVRGTPPAGEQSLLQRILPNSWRPQATAEQAMSDREDGEDGEVAEREEQLEAEQNARMLLHHPDPSERSDGIAALADLDEETARNALEGALSESEPDSDVRWETYDKLMDLSETETDRIRVAISALSDSLAPVRDQAAYYLSTEDADAHPDLVPAMRRALAEERDPDAHSSIESALETLDPEFVPAWQLEDAQDEITAIQ